MKAALRFAALVALLVPALAMADGLSLVPSDSLTVGVANLAQFRSSPIAGKLFDQTDKMTVDGEAAQFLAETGLDPRKDIDVVTFALTPREGNAKESDPLVIFEGRFDAARIAQAIRARGVASKQVGDHTIFLPSDEDQGEDGPPALAFVGRSTLVAGNEAAVTRALATAKAGGSDFLAASPLGQQMHRVDPNASAWVLVDVPRISRLHDQPEWQGEQDHPARALVDASKKISTVALWTTDSGTQLEFGVTALTSDAETRQNLEDMGRGLLAAWRMAAQEKDPELVDVIRQFQVKQAGDAVTLTGSITGDTLKKFTERHRKAL